MWYLIKQSLHIVSVIIDGASPGTISNFVPSVSQGYTVTPNNPNINVTSSGDLITNTLYPNDSGIYTISSPDHGGATIVITISIRGN